MSSVHKYVAVNNPDIPLLTPECNADPRMGVLTDVSGLMGPTETPSGYEARLHDIYLPLATVRTYSGKLACNVRMVTDSVPNGECGARRPYPAELMTTVLTRKSQRIVVGKGYQAF